MTTKKATTTKTKDKKATKLVTIFHSENDSSYIPASRIVSLHTHRVRNDDDIVDEVELWLDDGRSIKVTFACRDDINKLLCQIESCLAS